VEIWGCLFLDLFAVAEGVPEIVLAARKPMPLGCFCTISGSLSSASISIFMSLSQPSISALWCSIVIGEEVGSVNGTPGLGICSPPLEPGTDEDHGRQCSNSGRRSSFGVLAGWLYRADGVAKPLLMGSLPLPSPHDRRETLADIEFGVGELRFGNTGKWVMWSSSDRWAVGSMLDVSLRIGDF